MVGAIGTVVITGSGTMFSNIGTVLKIGSVLPF
jgi:hypothetical protein